MSGEDKNPFPATSPHGIESYQLATSSFILCITYNVPMLFRGCTHVILSGICVMLVFNRRVEVAEAGESYGKLHSQEVTNEQL